MPVSQIRPGQTGYGLTVFYGYQVERFKVKVIDILYNFLPKQDLILMRIAHPRLVKAKVVGGMSGSPIFIDGKLVGALAYGWRFSAEPIAGITPIANMLDVLKRPLRKPGAIAAERWRRQQSSRALALLRADSKRRRDGWWRAALPFRGRQPHPSQDLIPATLPLSVAGFAPQALGELRQLFGPLGFEPVQGGGAGGALNAPRHFEPGGAIGIQMVRGDVSMSGTGTVTWVRDNQVLGFGHSAFNAGQIELPVVTSRINHTLASLGRSFKLSTPGEIIGALVQDRQAAIHADTSRRSPMIPMVLTLKSKRFNRTYRTQIARHELLTGSLTSVVVTSALSEAFADVDRATFSMNTAISLRGLAPIRVSEQHFSARGIRQAPAFVSRGLRALQAALGNPYRELQVDRIDIGIDVNYGEEVVLVEKVVASRQLVRPGEQVMLTVHYRSYGGSPFTQRYPLTIPESLADAVLRVHVGGGSSTTPIQAPPTDLKQYLRHIQTHFPGRSLVISLQKPAKSILYDGAVLDDLPDSVIDTLNRGSGTQIKKIFMTVDQHVHATQRVISGAAELRLHVKRKDS